MTNSALSNTRTRNCRWTLVAIVWLLSSACCVGAVAATERVAATVNGTPILVRRVQQIVMRVLAKREATPEAMRVLQARALEQLIGRRLTLGYLQDKRQVVSDQEVDVALDRLERELARQEKTIDDYLQDRKWSRDELQHEIRWKLSWRRLLDRQLVDDKLQQYFEKHGREFDGTRLRVAHVLLKTPNDNVRQRAMRQLASARQAIVDGRKTFAETARQLSDAPTGRSGGQLGWIGRHEPMPEAFSQAAFQLDVDEISTPVTTPLGAHLIQCLEIEPGQKDWRQVRGKLIRAVTRDLFQRVCKQQRPRATIQYTGAMPHFKPGTRELADR